ncbi:enoyl-CoA hydratase-related protein [Variovorax ginsengisoli]|uniref:2-(1,2-epoxy-1,2-dihydrophenyl)acetyl-CoA isomerase n=1 Tax=Variovorax ginsengisoli TaxID=363844 RepID=A0ABT9S9H3_9BURK|nr:enoyl-CoA hydratase-related protein [Variovorax ginsengisoli]MDP9901011.1 2-(1,2-epoxy-1,2-dihydrophenyl)acetyl-CoA isomerase [Variovorax ginsengisoli]
MTESWVQFDIDGQVATLTLNDPGRMNPLGEPLVRACLDALRQVRDDHRIRALVLTGRGRAFSAGADLPALAAPRPAGAPSLGAEVAALMTEGGNRLVEQLRALPVPVVCALQGAAVGGGAGLALAGDIVVAARSSYFYLPFIPALGIVPDMGSSWFLPRAAGRARAMGLALLGDRVSAEQAAQWGLIWACVDDDQLPAEAARLADQLAALPAHAIQEARALFDASAGHTLAQQLDYERDRQRELIDGPCFAEGVQAFLHKRRPVFPPRA